MHDLMHDEEGATAIEYGLIAALVAIVIISGIFALNQAMTQMYSSITTRVEDAMNN
ncbi:MAG: Flp family type IVb pilin [Myxococcota bacterium]